jgi:hypothetical protein
MVKKSFTPHGSMLLQLSRALGIGEDGIFYSFFVDVPRFLDTLNDTEDLFQVSVQ